MAATTELDEQIEKLRKGDTLAENEVKVLCEKVSKPMDHGIGSLWFFSPEAPYIQKSECRISPDFIHGDNSDQSIAASLFPCKLVRNHPTRYLVIVDPS